MGPRASEVNLLSLIYFLAVLSILVLVHEFGHFIMAKRLGVRVEKFSFGFGPKLFSVKKGDTEYLISALLLGGYVKFAGDEPGEELAHRSWEFLSRSILDRFKIIFAGPLLNYILAFLIFSIIFMFGSPTLTTEVGGLLKGYPAEKAGILIGDKVIAIDGKTISYGDALVNAINRRTKGSLKLTIERGGKIFVKEIKPIVKKQMISFGKEVEMAFIGIQPAQKIEKGYDFFGAIYMGSQEVFQITVVTYKALWAMMRGRLSLKESVTGPIGIYMITVQMAKLGLIYFFHFMGFLSASLTIFNTLPFPVLDGGHIIFLALEKLRGKPVPVKAQELITNIGFSFLILLGLFIFYNDIVKFGIFEKAAAFFK